MREIVAVAGCAADEEAIEELLDTASIDYDIGFDAAERGDAHRVCLLGRSYAVDAHLAGATRDLLRGAGFAGAVVETRTR